ncbi:MAG: 4'-phosphopantetheinyl transferase superfamily protein [Eubacterium sp.]|nr:4'-phosphopantetheinyl transferase superfamily protein [Eubacterium sp.]
MKELTYIYKLNGDISKWNSPEAFDMLPDWRKEKAEKIVHEKARIESIVAGHLLIYALSRYAGCSETEVRAALDSEKHDKDNRSIGLHNAIYYNISHSGNYIAVAVSDKPVGVDVETKDDKDFKVTSRMFTEEDKNFIGDSQDRFRQVWTLKESFLKCTGQGISVPLNCFTFDYKNEKIRRVISKGYELKGSDYYAVTRSLDEGAAAISICSSHHDLILDIKWVEVLI